MQFEATVTTHKASTRPAVVPGGMSAGGALLRGMPRVNHSHHTTPFFGLIRDKRAHLCKRPTMHTARGFRLTFDRRALANIRQVLKNNRCARLTGLDNLLAQDMIAVFTKPCLLASEVSQVALGRRRTFPLQLAFQLEALAFDVLPATLAQKGRSTCNSGTRQAQVYTDDGLRGQYQRRWQGHNDVQVPVSTFVDQISSIDGESCVLLGIDWHTKAQCLTPCCCRKPDSTRRPMHAVRIRVIARRACGTARLRDSTRYIFTQRKGATQRLSSFDPCLINQITDQRRMGRLHRIVGKVMQLGSVTDILVPSNINSMIKSRRKHITRVGEYRCLGICRFKYCSYSSLHMGIIPYNIRFVDEYLEGLNLSDYGRFRCLFKQAVPLPGCLWNGGDDATQELKCVIEFAQSIVVLDLARS